MVHDLRQRIVRVRLTLDGARENLQEAMAFTIKYTLWE
jgi:hypothetical protein